MSNDRRQFLKLSLLTAASLGLLSIRESASAQAPAAGKKLPLVSEADPMAKSLGFHLDASKVDVKKWSKKAGPDGKTQLCQNCLLFNGGKITKDAEAPCTLFPGKAVPAAGWCNSFAKNPAAK